MKGVNDKYSKDNPFGFQGGQTKGWYGKHHDSDFMIQMAVVSNMMRHKIVNSLYNNVKYDICTWGVSRCKKYTLLLSETWCKKK